MTTAIDARASINARDYFATIFLMFALGMVAIAGVAVSMPILTVIAGLATAGLTIALPVEMIRNAAASEPARSEVKTQVAYRFAA